MAVKQGVGVTAEVKVKVKRSKSKLERALDFFDRFCNTQKK